MLKPRDSQRSKLYRAEHEAFGEAWSKNGHFTLPQAEAYVKRVWRSKFVQNKFPLTVINHVPRVTDGRGRRKAAGSISHIKLPRWARTKPVILHEIAHALSVADREAHGPMAAHGWQFARRFIVLVQRFLGKEEARKLKTAFRKHRVRYNPKRKIGI